MVPYEQLLPIEQAIVDFRNAYPMLNGFIFGVMACAVVAIIIAMWKKSDDDYAEKVKRERAAKRAWIKANGGL